MRRDTNKNQSNPTSSNFNKPKLFGIIGILLIILVLILLKFSKCNNTDVKPISTDLPNINSPRNTESTAIIKLVEINSITGTTANCNITYNFIDQSQIKELGIVYNTSPNPSIEKYNNRKTKSNPLSNDIILLDNLYPNTIYYVRAYLVDINDKIIYTTDEKKFTTGDINLKPSTSINSDDKNQKSVDNQQNQKVTLFNLKEENPNLSDNRMYIYFNFSNNFIFDEYKIIMYGHKKENNKIIPSSSPTYTYSIKIKNSDYLNYANKFKFPFLENRRTEDKNAIKNVILNLYELVQEKDRKNISVSAVYLGFEFYRDNNLVGKTNLSNLYTGSCKPSGDCILQPFNDNY